MPPFQYIASHPHLRPLEEHWQSIRDEYLQAAHRVVEWPEKDLHNGLWDVLGVHYPDQRMPGEMLCPVTHTIVRQIPGLFMAGFSVLRPGAMILPHRRAVAGVWRVHLGLICPPGAWLDVDGQRHVAREGKIVVFDDLRIHAAANQDDSDRVVLIVDVWKDGHCP
ncbi:aspartyl/asparaginyl beta-hydroxylase domain-containing protein [Herbaspirillum huttiense]|uniref:aspartyl/asparaginyl beta-hydroxylase domain-containing protein n=1 Tax=Herbaspirillum huttiense TaxID=863372 RepID=UPI0031D93FFB